MVLWEIMDGQHTVTDLTLAYFDRFRRFGLSTVLTTIVQLSAAGFIQIQPIPGQEQPARTGRWSHLVASLQPWLIHYVALPDIDGLVTALYRFLFRPLYTRIGAALLAAVAIAGALLAVRSVLMAGPHTLGGGVSGLVAPVAAASLAVQLCLHEVAHAITCKHFGREVHRAGVDWYLFEPVAFVDTSDIWLAGRLPRALVAFAGPATNFILSGLAMLLLVLPLDPAWQTVLGHFAATGYAIGIVNLNPLIAFDGYYLLIDLVDIPNLRANALAFLGARLWGVAPTTTNRRLGRMYGAYGALALLYIVVLAASLLAGYHVYLDKIARHLLPPVLAAALGWTLAGTMCWLILSNA